VAAHAGAAEVRGWGGEGGGRAGQRSAPPRAELICSALRAISHRSEDPTCETCK
jgi:hypothetical protein